MSDFDKQLCKNTYPFLFFLKKEGCFHLVKKDLEGKVEPSRSNKK